MTFHRAVKSWLKQLDPDGDFIPIRGILGEKHFGPLYLVVEREQKYKGRITFSYDRTGYKLQDVLCSGAHTIKQDSQDSQPFTIVDQVDGKVEGHLGGCVEQLATVEAKGDASMSHTKSVKVKKAHVRPQDLDLIQEEGKVNMDHKLIKESEQNGRDIYVITETIQTMEETQCEEWDKAEGRVLFKFHINVGLKGVKNRKKGLTIPKNCIVAFRVKKLYIGNGYVDIPIYPHGDIGTFDITIEAWFGEDGMRYRHMSYDSGLAVRAQSAQLQEYRTKLLQGEVNGKCAELFLLPEHLHGKFLNGFVAIMTEDDFLQDLEFQLKQALDSRDQIKLKADRPELQVLIENLQDSSGAIITHLAEPVLYFLQALGELTEFQLVLLAESVEKNILSKQLTLVGNILDDENNFTVDAELVSWFVEEDLNITGAMIELSGVTVQRDGLSLSGAGDSDAFLALETLYVALYTLTRLQ